MIVSLFTKVVFTVHKEKRIALNRMLKGAVFNAPKRLAATIDPGVLILK
jgi:aminoglycoside/choline kinase family phosphotransferase